MKLLSLGTLFTQHGQATEVPISYQGAGTLKSLFCNRCGQLLHLLGDSGRESFQGLGSCWNCYDEMDMAEEAERLSALEAHPFDMLPRQIGHGVDACSLGSNHIDFDRNKDFWTDLRRRSNESRTHSRGKKPWRRVQKFVEANKSTIHVWFDLGIPPEELRRAHDAEREHMTWEDSVNDTCCWFGDCDEYDTEEELPDVYDWFDDPVLYGDYPNPYCDGNVEEVLREQVWDGNHREGCSCSDCTVDEYGYLSDYDHKTGVSDHFDTGCNCTYCQGIMLEVEL